MTVAGLDIGGTKIEVRVFDSDWQEIARNRCATPSDYSDFNEAIAGQINWAQENCGTIDAIGVGTAGLINPKTGLALTANLPASGKPFQKDIENAIDRPITLVNDCRALALSEAVFGAGRGHRTVMGVILGTGIGGGIAVDGKLLPGPTAIGGEFGHFAAPAHVIDEHKLPIFKCGCGRTGCIETYVAGPGLERLAKHVTGQMRSAPEIAERRTGDMAEVWALWCSLAAELIHTLTATVDPDLIVLGGGLSRVPSVVEDLTRAAEQVQIPSFGAAPLAFAQGGDASGAIGAAYAAWTDRQYG